MKMTWAVRFAHLQNQQTTNYMIETLKDFYRFFKKNKKWWLIPILLFLIFFGALIIYANGSAIAPFVYSFF